MRIGCHKRAEQTRKKNPVLAGLLSTYSLSPAQSVTLGTEFGLSAGTFMLSLHHRNVAANTTQARNKKT